MPTPTGQIGLSDVNVELGKSSSTQIAKNDTDVRQLAGRTTPLSQISMDDLRGKSFDTVGPTVTITASSTTLSIGQTSTLTFTLSEASTNFIAADINISAGSISNFSGSGTSYTATYTPPASSSGSATINVPANRLTDSTGNQNSASNTITINYDTQAPGITITSSSLSLSGGGTATITFTLTESSVNFSAADVSVSSGSLTGFSGSGSSYTATYTAPTSGTSATISVAANTFTDSFGNNNTASNTVTISFSAGYSVSPNVSSANEGGSVTYTVTTTNVANGTTLYWTLATGTNFCIGSDFTDFSDNGSFTINSNSGSFTLYLRSDLTTETTETLRVQIRVNSTGGTVVATASDVTVFDTSITPTVSLSPTTLQDGTVNIGYSQSIFAQVDGNNTPASFSISGFLPPGLSGSGFGSVGEGYFVGFSISGTPTSIGSYTFTVNATTNNGYFPSRQYTITIAASPTMSISTSSTSLSYNQTATLTFTSSQSTNNFTVQDVTQSGSGILANFSGSGTTYTATFTPPASTTGSTSFSVAAGAYTNSNSVGNLASNTVTINYNTTAPDTTAPTISISSSSGSLSSGQTATITFTLSESSTNFTSGDVTVTAGSLTGFSGSGTSYSATFTPPANSSGSATISVAANSFTDAAGNGNTPSNNLNINYNTVTGGGGGVSIISPLGFNGGNYQDYQPDAGYANSTLSINRNGTFTIIDSFSSTLASGNWANSPSSTIGDTVYVRFTRTANNVSATGGSSASTGWQQLNVDRVIFVYESTPNTWLVSSSANYTVELSNSSSGSPVASTSTVTLSAVTNTYDGGIQN